MIAKWRHRLREVADDVRFVVGFARDAVQILLVFALPEPRRRVTDPDEWAKANRHDARRHNSHPHNPDRDWNPGETFAGGSVRPVNPNEKRKSNVQR